MALVVRVAADEPLDSPDEVADAEPDTVTVGAVVALVHAEVVTDAQGEAVAERRGELDVEADAVVERDTTTDTEDDPESDLEPLGTRCARRWWWHARSPSRSPWP